jgi:mycothiol synthase
VAEQFTMERPTLLDLPTVQPLAEGYALRLASGPEDERALARVLTAAFGEPWDIARVQSSLTQTPEVIAVHVATWQGEIVATASCLSEPAGAQAPGWVHWVGALPDHTGKGLGTALVVRVLEDFAGRGYRSARLLTDDFRLPAIRSYLRCGLLPVYNAGSEDHRERWSAVMQGIFAGR